MDPQKVTRLAMANEFAKIANEGISAEEAAVALKRLRKLEASAPTKGELARNAMAGMMVMPVMTNVSGLISGRHPLQDALSKKTLLGKPVKGALERGLKLTGRGMLAAGVSGSILGAGMPVIRQKLHTEAEKQKLREFLGKSRHGRLRGKVKKELGV